MKVCRLITALVVLVALLLGLCPLLNAAPAPELALLQRLYAGQLAERVTGPYEAALAQLNAGYSSGLDRAITEAKKGGDLDLVIALEDEKQRLVDKAPLPEIAEETPADLKRLRPIYLTALAKRVEERTENHNELLPGYTERLKELEVTLTKADRVGEAKEVKAYREGLEEGFEGLAATGSKTGDPAKGKGPKGDDRMAAAMLLDHDATVTVKTGKGETLVLKPGVVLPKEDFEILRFEQSIRSTKLLTVEDAAVLANLQSLTNVQFYSGPVGNQVMEALQGSPGLSTLYLVGDGSLTDEAFASLKHWPNLDNLLLNGCSGITGEGIRIIVETRPEIRKLQLLDASIDDTALPHLLKLKGLEDLHIARTKITEIGLEKLAGLRNLTSLGLSGGAMTAPMDFTTFKKLRKLLISHSVSEALFLSLGKFPATIEELSVAAVEMTEAQFAILAKGKGLKKIAFHQLKLPPSQLASFAATAKVEEVEIYSGDVSINDECLMQLSRIETLKKLSLGKGTTAAGLAAFKEARPDVVVGP